MSQQNINGYTTEQTNLSNDDWFDIDAYLGVDDYESRKVSFGTMKAKILSEASNIYNSNGTLTASRQVDCNNNDMEFFQPSLFGTSDAVNLFFGVDDGSEFSNNAPLSDPYWRFTIGTNRANNLKSVGYYFNYPDNWDSSTPLQSFPTLGFVTANGTTANRPTQGIVGQQYYNNEENQLEIYDGNSWTNSEPSIQSKGNAIADFYHYSFSTGQSNNDFFNDGNIKLSWDTNGNDLELYMLTEPLGTGDLVAIATKGVTSSVSTYITQPNFKYDVYPAGVNATEGLVVWVSAELDPSYPTYKIFIHNAGSSYNSSVEVKVITPK